MRRIAGCHAFLFLGFDLVSDGTQGVGQRLAVRALELAALAVGQLGVLRILGRGENDYRRDDTFSYFLPSSGFR